MAELDLLLDSLLEQRDTPKASYIEDRDVETLKLEQTTSKGEGVFAKRFLSVQDPICALVYPTMMAIDSDSLSTTCYHCLVVTACPLPHLKYGHAPIDLKICNGCHVARFCGRKCQLQAWPYHKYECKIFKRTKQDLLPATPRAVLRVVLLKDRDMLQSEVWNRILQLTSHDQTLAARGRSNLTDMAEGIKHLAQSSMSVALIQKLLFIMRSNANELPSPIHGGIGVMLDPLVAKINHSCQPNVAMYRPQHTMTSGWMDSASLSEDERRTLVQIIPLRDIQEGEELLNSYVVSTMSVESRKATLMENYLFECACDRCVSDTEAATEMTAEHPVITARFGQWAKHVDRNISQAKRNQNALQKAAAVMDRSEQYLEYPVLYTTGDYPERAMLLILEGLKAQAFDEALVNALRLHFLVNPERFVGRHNPTNFYTVFLLLAIFDVLVGSPDAADISKDKVEKSLSNLSSRGLGNSGVAYWRRRICADVRKRLEASAAKDLVLLTREQEEPVQRITVQGPDMKREEWKDKMEQEMRMTLKLKELKWKNVLLRIEC